MSGDALVEAGVAHNVGDAAGLVSGTMRSGLTAAGCASRGPTRVPLPPGFLKLVLGRMGATSAIGSGPRADRNHPDPRSTCVSALPWCSTSVRMGTPSEDTGTRWQNRVAATAVIVPLFVSRDARAAAGVMSATPAQSACCLSPRTVTLPGGSGPISRFRPRLSPASCPARSEELRMSATSAGPRRRKDARSDPAANNPTGRGHRRDWYRGGPCDPARGRPGADRSGATRNGDHPRLPAPSARLLTSGSAFGASSLTQRHPW